MPNVLFPICYILLHLMSPVITPIHMLVSDGLLLPPLDIFNFCHHPILISSHIDPSFIPLPLCAFLQLVPILVSDGLLFWHLRLISIPFHFLPCLYPVPLPYQLLGDCYSISCQIVYSLSMLCASHIPPLIQSLNLYTHRWKYIANLFSFHVYPISLHFCPTTLCTFLSDGPLFPPLDLFLIISQSHGGWSTLFWPLIQSHFHFHLFHPITSCTSLNVSPIHMPALGGLLFPLMSQ